MILLEFRALSNKMRSNARNLGYNIFSASNFDELQTIENAIRLYMGDLDKLQVELHDNRLKIIKLPIDTVGEWC